MTFGSCEQNQRKFDQVFEVPFCPPIYLLVMVLGLLGWWLSYWSVLHFGDSLGPFDKKVIKNPSGNQNHLPQGFFASSL